MRFKPVAILATGCVTPVGTNTAETVASVYAGISRIGMSPFVDREYQNLRFGYLPPDVLGYTSGRSMYQTTLNPYLDRLLCYTVPALRECMSVVSDTMKIPILLATSKREKWGNGSGSSAFFEQLVQHSGVQYDVASSVGMYRCRAGLFHTIVRATRMLAAQAGSDLVVAGGIDSYWDMSLLDALLAEDRILTDRTSDAFIPGEGCALLLLGTEHAARRLGVQPLAWITAVGLGNESGHRYSKKPYLGEGLAQAFAGVFGKTGGKRSAIKTVFAGLIGESFNAKEWGVAYQRNQEYFEEELTIEHPAEYFGDAGAALAPIMITAAAYGLSKGLWEGPILAWASADKADRGAVLLSKTVH